MAAPLAGTPISSINQIPMMAKRRRRRDVVDTLPLEIIHDILVRLPVKILTKFRLVCKPWNSLISHRRFQDDHYRRHQQNRLLIRVEMNYGYGHHYITTYNKERITSLPKTKEFQLSHVNNFSVPDRDCSIRNYRIQSCLVLVCVASVCQDRIFVCNPSTGERLVLPPTSGQTTCVGFGYAASTKEFKVVRFYYSCKTTSYNVFTLGTDAWKEARSPAFQTLQFYISTAPFIQGALHLLHCKHNDFSITAFDLETEENKQIPVPKFYSTDVGAFQLFGLLSELGGSLCFIGKGRDILELWLLKDYKSGHWVKEYKIDLFLASRQKDIYRAIPLEILGDGSLLMSLYRSTWNELICYNPQHKVATQMIGSEGGSWGIFQETFQSLKGKS